MRRNRRLGRAAPAPTLIAQRYQRALGAFVDQLFASAEQILATWESNTYAMPFRRDSKWIADKVRLLAAEIDPILPAVRLVAEQTERNALGALDYLPRIDLRREIPGARRAEFRRRNVALIKSLGEEAKQRITETLEQAEREGWRVETLRSRILQDHEVSKSKADLLARDQTLKFNAEVTQARQRQAGIERYEWSTSGDERVREEHAALSGKIFAWDDPPEPGHPGEDYQCRCVAIPILPELE